MPSWKDALTRLTSELDVHVRAARDAVAARMVDERAPYEIAAYRGHGTATRVMVQGRALRSPGLVASTREDSPWRNLANMYRRIEADPLPHARVVARCAGGECEVVADEEGFFTAWLTPAAPLDATVDWHPAELELRAPLRPDVPPPRASTLVRVPASGVRFGVVSDVDDTVLQSNVTSLVQAVRTTLLSNARTRLPFPGVAAFYRALEAGTGGPRNPIFYVSSSPWNLYDIIAEFLEVQRIPAGAILLRDWDLNLDAIGSTGHFTHKTARIRELFERYPALPFILIGDSGQHDPEIYRDIVREHPDRVLAVYIRDVTRRPDRRAAIERLAEEVREARSSLVLAEDTATVARHAAERGWIDAAGLADVEREL